MCVNGQQLMSVGGVVTVLVIFVRSAQNDACTAPPVAPNIEIVIPQLRPFHSKLCTFVYISPGHSLPRLPSSAYRHLEIPYLAISDPCQRQPELRSNQDQIQDPLSVHLTIDCTLSILAEDSQAR